MSKNNYIQSPLNYTGGKYKLLKQIIPLFPEKDIEVFVDLFGGGFNVGINVNYPKIVYNEYDPMVYDVVKGICKSDTQTMLNDIDSLIKQYGLTKENKNGFLAFRNNFNNNPERHWIELYVLIAYSFNNQIRFNKKGEFNMPFGTNRSSFNDRLRSKFKTFSETAKSKKIYFYNNDFSELTSNDKVDDSYFFYVDPPYLITTASYNENGGWNIEKEKQLYNELDKLNEKGVKFAMSNVFEHKGKENTLLIEWSKKYNIHYLDYDYKNCSYHGKNTKHATTEVLITNY